MQLRTNAYSNFTLWRVLKPLQMKQHDARPASIVVCIRRTGKHHVLDNIDAVEMDEAIKTRMKRESLIFKSIFSYFQ